MSAQRLRATGWRIDDDIDLVSFAGADGMVESVIRELRETGALDREIDQGIERYVARQRAAAAKREEKVAASGADKVRPVSKTRDHIHSAKPITANSNRVNRDIATKVSSL